MTAAAVRTSPEQQRDLEAFYYMEARCSTTACTGSGSRCSALISSTSCPPGSMPRSTTGSAVRSR